MAVTKKQASMSVGLDIETRFYTNPAWRRAASAEAALVSNFFAL